MKRTLIFLHFKIVNNYTNIKANFKFISAKYGILNLGIRSWIRIQTFWKWSWIRFRYKKKQIDEEYKYCRGPTFGGFVTIRT
jgi:hypothetical protein